MSSIGKLVVFWQEIGSVLEFLARAAQIFSMLILNIFSTNFCPLQTTFQSLAFTQTLTKGWRAMLISVNTDWNYKSGQLWCFVFHHKKSDSASVKTTIQFASCCDPWGYILRFIPSTPSCRPSVSAGPFYGLATFNLTHSTGQTGKYGTAVTCTHIPSILDSDFVSSPWIYFAKT